MPLYRNRAAALLAMLAMTLSAFWPLIAQAKPRIPGERVPVCTIEGITHYIELPATETPVERRSSAHHEHCKVCVFGAERLATLSEAGLPLLVLAPVQERPQPPLYVCSSSSSLHPPAQPRAPPTAS